jgi:hypothetical protein
MTQPIADGTDVATGYRWWITREPSAAHPAITVTGFSGPNFICKRIELEHADQAAAERFCAAVAAGIGKEKRRRS